MLTSFHWLTDSKKLKDSWAQLGADLQMMRLLHSGITNWDLLRVYLPPNARLGKRKEEKRVHRSAPIFVSIFTACPPI